MKDEKIFDILEGAKDDSMERLIRKCPELSDDDLDRILEMSERKFIMKNKKIYGRNINEQQDYNGTTVSGVERVKKFSWTRTFTIAASFVLIAGLAAGSISLMNKNRTGSADSGAIVSDVAVTGTSEETVTTAETTAAPTDTSTSTTSQIIEATADAVIVTEPYATEVYTEPETEELTEAFSETETTEEYSEPEPEPETEGRTFAALNTEDIAGEWEFQISDGSSPVDENPVFNGTFTIYEIGLYEYTDVNGNLTTGSVRTDFEGLTDPVLPSVAFYSYTKLLYEGYCYDSHPDVILIGDGTYARLVRK